MPARKRPGANPASNHVERSSANGEGDGDGDGDAVSPSSSPEDGIRVPEEEEEAKPIVDSPEVEIPEANEEEDGEEDGLAPSQEVKKEDFHGDGEEEDSDEELEEADEDKPEYVLVELADIRREVQCPICLGIIRKTRTVMDCLHRFCRECIDRSMRLGNNECPACRTHCASRRSLRDDPNYDALIAALYPDIDKYEEEELSLHEEERRRNKKIQAYISETLQRQSEALGRRRSAKTAEAGFMRRSQRNFRSSRGSSRAGSRATSRATTAGSENEEGAHEGNEANEASPEAGRQKRVRRWTTSRAQPGPERSSAEPEEVSNRDLLAWGKNGVRSQTRHGGSGGCAGRSTRVDRVSRLVDHLHSLDENDDDMEVHLRLVPADGGAKTNASLERPFLCCRPTLSVNHLAKFVAVQMAVDPEDVEITMVKAGGDFQALRGQETIGCLQSCFSSPPFDLVLAYRARQHGSKEGASGHGQEDPSDGRYDFL
ncbi:putative E3 ubiquitin-protein ligase RING1b [Wolffia australiana]